MKKIIFLTVLVVGMVLTMGPGSKLVAGDRAHVIEAIVNNTRQLQETLCGARRVVPRDSGSKNSPQKCDSNDINSDDILDLYYAWKEEYGNGEEYGNSECATNYCRCLLGIDENSSSERQMIAGLACKQFFSNCKIQRLMEKLFSTK